VKWLGFGGGGLVVVIVLVMALSGGDDTATVASTEAATTSSEAATTSSEAVTTTAAATTTEAVATTVGPGEAAGEIFLEPAGSEGPDSFAAGEVFHAPVVSTTSTLVTTTTTTEAASTTAAGQVAVQGRAGDQPGLYGGTQDQARCDADAMLAFLQANFAKAQAWVDALNSDPDLLWGDGRTSLAVVDLEAYFAELTPVILLEDTRVTNHGFRNGLPTARQAVFQAGTAVLVDKYGVPRARCACGNPLIPPLPAPRPPVYVGPQWPGWSPVNVVIINQSVTIINQITLINVYTGVPFDRPVGTQGGTDVIVIIDVEPVVIAGVWVGTFVVTEILVPPGETLPDGTPIGPGGYTPESCREELSRQGALDAETAAALDELEAGLPLSATFSGSLDQPGTVLIVLAEGEDPQEIPWRVEGDGIAFDVVNDDGTISFIGGLEGNVISGAWSSSSSDGFEMIGVFTLTWVED